MLPFISNYIPLLMDVIVDESSEDEIVAAPPDQDSEEMMTDESEELSEHNDPEYFPGESDILTQDLSERTQAAGSQNDPDYVPESRSHSESALGRNTSHWQSLENVIFASSDEDNDKATASACAAPKAKPNWVQSPKDSEDDGQICTICFEQWTSSSEHRLVSLRCGHLFGRSCITRWLKGQNARCPQCNARARKSEIRNIYAKAVKVIDSSERDKALEDLKKETEMRRKAEIDAAQERLKHTMAVQECERLKKELMEANKLLVEYRAGLKISSCAPSTPSSVFVLEKCLEIAKIGGCRIVDSCDLLGMVLVSQPSANELFPGYGFRKIATHDMKPTEFVFVHQKPIRDMAFHVHDGLVLTASLDKSIKITNVLSNSVVHTYNLDSDVWSCAWDTDDPVYFYGGLKTGEVYVFDIRVTNRHVHQLPRFGVSTPVVSLQYLKSPVSISPRKYGPIVGKLSDGALQQKTEIPDFYTIVPLPPLGPFISLSADDSGLFLISCRPSAKQPRITHTVCEFVASPTGDLICNPLQSVVGGKTQLKLTRSKLLSHPDKASSLLICAGDEDAKGALIWDGSSGTCIDHLHTDSPVLDFAGLKINHKSFMIALTNESLRLYGWAGSNFS